MMTSSLITSKAFRLPFETQRFVWRCFELYERKKCNMRNSKQTCQWLYTKSYTKSSFHFQTLSFVSLKLHLLMLFFLRFVLWCFALQISLSCFLFLFLKMYVHSRLRWHFAFLQLISRRVFVISFVLTTSRFARSHRFYARISHFYCKCSSQRSCRDHLMKRLRCKMIDSSWATF